MIVLADESTRVFDKSTLFSFFVLCSAGKLQRDVYSQIYFDVSPGNGRQAKRQNKFENIHLSAIYRQNTKQRKFSLASLAYHAR